MDEAKIVYDNLRTMMLFQKRQIVEEPGDVIRELKTREYVVLQGTATSTSPPLRCVLLAPDTNYATKTADFKKMMTSVEAGAGDSRLMIVSSEPLTKNIMRVIGTASAHVYDLFMTVVPRHNTYFNDGEFRFTVTRDVPDSLRERYVTARQLECISVADPLAVWCGLQVGDIFEFDALCETTGVCTRIKRVV